MLYSQNQISIKISTSRPPNSESFVRKAFITVISKLCFYRCLIHIKSRGKNLLDARVVFIVLIFSAIPYIYYSLPYAGKPEKIEGSPEKYYITGMDEFSKYLITCCLHTATFIGSIYHWIATSHQFPWQHEL